MELKLDITDLVQAVGGLLEYPNKDKDMYFSELVYDLVTKTLQGSDLAIQEVVEFMSSPRKLAKYIADNNIDVRRIVTELDVRKMIIEGDLEVYIIDRRQALPIATEDYHLALNYTQAPILHVTVEVTNVNTGDKIRFSVQPTGITTIDPAVSNSITATIIRERKALGL